MAESQCTQPPTPRGLRMSMQSFLVLILLPLLLLMLPSLIYIFVNIQRLDQTIEVLEQHSLPTMAQRHQTLFAIESLWRHIDVIALAEDSLLRHTASLNAFNLSSNTIFIKQNGLDEYANSASLFIQNLVEARNQYEQSKELFHEQELLFMNEVLYLASHVERPPCALFTYNNFYDSALRENRLYEVSWDEITKAITPLLTFCDTIPPNTEQGTRCTRVLEYWAQMGVYWQQSLEHNKDAMDLWRELQSILRQSQELVQNANTLLNQGSLETLRQSSESTHLALALTVLCLFLCAGCDIVLIHRFIVQPITLTADYLAAARKGAQAEQVPHILIRELREIVEQLPSLGAYVAELNARSGQLEEEKGRLENLSYIDGLTGINNRRCFDRQLEREHRQTQVSILMADVDHFKQYNDSLGHQAGDIVLTMVANAMQKALLRSSDQVFRYGGEEFVVLLPDTDAKAAMGVAERILKAVQDLGIPHPSPDAPLLTVSIGVATRHLNDKEPLAMLVERADKALYHAKSTGRNRICIDEDIPASPTTEG